MPSILADLADPAGGSAWIELRKASWIINGYLLVYILTMPMAGRLADLWGARRLFIGALVVFTVGSALAGAAQTLDQLIAARLVQAVGGGVLGPGRDRGGGAPVRRRRPTAGARRGRRADLPRHGGRARRRGRDPRLGPPGGGPRDGRADRHDAAAILDPAWRWVFYINIPIGIIAIALAWAASADWETPRRPGRVDIVGALWFGLALLTGLIGLTLLGSTEIAGTAIDAGGRDGHAARGRGDRRRRSPSSAACA